MLAPWRTFLLVQTGMVWQGGFLFYAAVVVPVGTDVLGSPILQGFVTQEVTRWLNWIGIAFHLLLGWELLAERGGHRRRSRVGLCTVSALLLVALIVLHPVLDSFLDPVEQTVNRSKIFYQWHSVYLWISALQWALGLGNAWLWLLKWREPPLPRSPVARTMPVLLSPRLSE